MRSLSQRGLLSKLIAYYFSQNKPIPIKAVTINLHSFLKILKDGSYLDNCYIEIQLISVSGTSSKFYHFKILLNFKISLSLPSRTTCPDLLINKTKSLIDTIVSILEVFYLNSTLNFGIPLVLVFQLEVCCKVDRILTGITVQQKGTTARCYSNKTSLCIF